MTPFSRLATRIYALALLCFPSHHRAEYRAEMIDTFSRGLADRRQRHGAWSALRFAVASAGNAIAAGLGERRRGRMPDTRGGRGFSAATFGRDLIHAARSLAKARAFTLVCVVSLGIGMGTVIGIMVALRLFTGVPPGVKAPGLVELLITANGADGRTADTWSYPDFAAVRDAGSGMTLAAWTTGQSAVRLPGAAAAARMDTMFVSAPYFDVIGAPVVLGRGFSQAESAGSGLDEVIISHNLWQTRFGADTSVIGRPMMVNGVPHLIVGIAPLHLGGHLAQHRPGFDVWLPLGRHSHLAGSRNTRFDRNTAWVRVLGRLAPGATLFSANAAVTSIMAGLAEQFPGSNTLKAATVTPYFPLGARQRGDARLERALGFIAAGLVLLVICLNVSGMVLVRSATRERELAVRLALGASRARLVQSLLAEALVLATLGGALGASAIFAAPAIMGWWLEFPIPPTMRPDALMAASCVGLCFVTSLVFGLAPAVRFSRPTMVTALKDDAGGGGHRVGRIQRWTAAVQAGMAVPFLITGGLLLDEVQRTARADLGFKPAGLYAAPIDSTSGTTDEAEAVRDALERSSAIESVALAEGLPLDGQYYGRQTQIWRENAPARVRAQTTRVSPAYFETLGLRLLRGRGFTIDDQAGAPLVVVLSQPLATRLFGDTDPLGARVTFALEAPGEQDPRWAHASMPTAPQEFTVVGITPDSVGAHLGPDRAQLFVPLAQHPAWRVYAVARSTAPESTVTTLFEQAVASVSLHPDASRAAVVTGEALVRRQTVELVMGSIISAVTGVVALTLAALGVFGVIGFMVATRTREIGIRMALGATRSRVLGSVLADALKLAVPGVGVGLLAGIAVVKELSAYSLGVVEPMLYTIAVAAALLVALLAGLPAARRAARIEPLIAMKSE